MTMVFQDVATTLPSDNLHDCLGDPASVMGVDASEWLDFDSVSCAGHMYTLRFSTVADEGQEAALERCKDTTCRERGGTRKARQHTYMSHRVWQDPCQGDYT